MYLLPLVRPNDKHQEQCKGGHTKGSERKPSVKERWEEIQQSNVDGTAAGGSEWVTGSYHASEGKGRETSVVELYSLGRSWEGPPSHLKCFSLFLFPPIVQIYIWTIFNLKQRLISILVDFGIGIVSGKRAGVTFVIWLAGEGGYVLWALDCGLLGAVLSVVGLWKMGLRQCRGHSLHTGKNKRPMIPTFVNLLGANGANPSISAKSNYDY